VNFTHIAGHLGADPDVRFTSTGKKVTTLRVATRTRKGQADDTIWWRVTIWGDQYDKMIPHLKKGSSIIVAGDMHKPEIFNDKDGKPRVSLDITAAYLQFSPFGKVDANASGKGTYASNQPDPISAEPLRGSLLEESFNASYAGGNNSPVSKGDFLDEETPF